MNLRPLHACLLVLSGNLDASQPEPCSGETGAAGQDPARESPTSAPATRPATRPARRPAAPRLLTAFDQELRARQAFALLAPKEQLEVIDWFETEAKQLRGFQSTLLQFVLGSAGRDAGSYPPLGEPYWYDPVEHAPAQPIPRKLLDEDEPDVARARAQILGAVAPRQLQSAWNYDYATREPQRLPDERDPQRIFFNGLLGLPPGWDLAEALVEQMLDDGSLQKHFQAFGHSYTDRNGGVYPGITLYDAHASNTAIEMPDLDCVGLIHTILDDWTTWKAVISNSQQEPLYSRIAELFAEAHHHRGLRHNLARAFLCGSTELRDGYQYHLDRFHALWESAASTPAKLAERLPKPAEWTAFLQGWSDECEAQPEQFLKGIGRRYTLEQNAKDVRARLLWVLEQFGAYGKLDSATPPAGR